MGELNCRSCQKLMRVGEMYIDGLCGACQNIKRHNIEQTRLDKVLAKFKKDDIGYSYDKCNIWIEYNWDDKKDDKFRLGLFNDIVVSLTTVEHLIKDMEAQDE